VATSSLERDSGEPTAIAESLGDVFYRLRSRGAYTRLEPDDGKLSSPVLRGGSGSNAVPLPDPRGRVPGGAVGGYCFCRHCRSPEPLVCHWVAPGECLVEGNADPGAFPRTKDPLGSRSEATTHPFVS